MTWLGTKRIAFVPVYRTVTLPDPPDVLPAEWSSDIARRATFDPDPTTGADRSLRAYIRAASSGRADLEATVEPMVTVDRKDVRPAHPDMQELASRLRDRGFDAAAIVMLGLPPAGTAEEGGFLARFVMREWVGTWAMELMHVLTGFTDLRCVPGFIDCEGGLRDIGNFDNMAFNRGMHPTAYTKAAVQWLDASAIANQTGRIGAYELHPVGLAQPPPAGRVTAVRIGSAVPYLMVEARLKVDQFESPSQVEPGIPSEGVIAYRVQTSDPLGHAQNSRIPLYLFTPVAMGAGQSVVSDVDVAVTVTGSTTDSFAVLVENRRAPFDSGQLLSFGDNGGPGNVSDPVVVGLGGWADFKVLFAGRDRIYAVDNDDQLLSYGDSGSLGNVSDPVVVGFGGWSDFKALFAGRDRIYAVDNAGQLLSYGDNGAQGNVSDPVVVGFGGWGDFKALFAGGDRIYAVDNAGQLLSYGDNGGAGNVSDPVVVGFGGWGDFKALFAGRDRIYAVDNVGQLLSFGDNGGPGNVSDPVVVGFGGWSDFKALFAGRDRIYAVVT